MISVCWLREEIDRSIEIEEIATHNWHIIVNFNINRVIYLKWKLEKVIRKLEKVIRNRTISIDRWILFCTASGKFNFMAPLAILYMGSVSG